MSTETVGPPPQGVVIDKTMPWAKWPNPRVITTTMDDLRIIPGNERDILMTDRGEPIGLATRRGLQELSWKVGFDAGFVTDKLPVHLATDVINHRIAADRADREVCLVVEGDRFTSFLPAVREVLPYQETAQVAHNVMSDLFGRVTVDYADAREGMSVRLLTDLEQPVTRKKGDVLQMGVQVRQDYGTSITVDLYLRRLVCLNGMTAASTDFSWQNKFEGTRAHQTLWLSASIAEALGVYDQVVTRSRLMASTRFDGDPETALRERARAMKFPMRHFAALLEAFQAEPGNSEWDLLNAMTRVATHAGLPNNLGSRMQAVAGEWSRAFDVVTARMPRPLAVATGARIIADIEAIGAAHEGE